MYYTKQVISIQSQIRFAFASSLLFTFRDTLISSPTLAQLRFIADRSLHGKNTCSTYAWDKGAVTKANDSFEILAHWASFKCLYCRASVSSERQCSLTCRGWDRPLCWSSQQHHALTLRRVLTLQWTPISAETMKGRVHIEQLQIWNVAGVCMRASCTMIPGLFCMLVPCSIKIQKWLKVCYNE